MTQPASSLDRTGASPPATGPLEQPVNLLCRRADPNLSEPLLAPIERDRGVDRVCGSIPIITPATSITSTNTKAGKETAAGTSEFRDDREHSRLFSLALSRLNSVTRLG